MNTIKFEYKFFTNKIQISYRKYFNNICFCHNTQSFL